MAQKKASYGNESISALKGADRVRKRPGVIFGSDGLEGCEHAVFEIMSNAIDEAREGHGSLITVTRFLDRSIQVEDQGRGCPVDWNEKEQKYNWELVFCELYAGGKYGGDGDNYEYSLGLNGLGSCATQYASRTMDVTVWRDGQEYSLHFERGENVGGLSKKPLSRKRTGTRIRWLPDLDVFTDIAVPAEYFMDVMKRQAVVNAGITFRFRDQRGASFETVDYLYENGILEDTADGSYHPDQNIDTKTFLTMVLNALGYVESGQDLDEEQLYATAVSCGLLTDAEAKEMKKDSFTRATLVLIAEDALNTKLSGTDYTLYQFLDNMGVIESLASDRCGKVRQCSVEAGRFGDCGERGSHKEDHDNCEAVLGNPLQKRRKIPFYGI